MTKISENNNKPSVEKRWLRYIPEENRNIATPKRTLYEHLYLSNINNMNGLAIDYYDRKIKFKKLFEMIDECSRAFSKLGVKKGDAVAICMPNTPEALASIYALNNIGAAPNMIHPLKSQAEINSYIKETNCKYVVALDDVVPKISGDNLKVISCSADISMPLVKKIVFKIRKKSKQLHSEGLQNVDVISWRKFIANGKGATYTHNSYSKDELAVLLHTGGTSGDAKTVPLSNDNINSMITQFGAMASNFSAGDKMLTIMPIFHGFGLCSSVHLPLCNGVSIILVAKFSKNDLPKLLKKRPNHIIGVPTLFNAMMSNKKLKESDLSCLKYVVYGADKMKNEEEFNEFLKAHNCTSSVCKGYGLTEAVAGVTFSFNGCNKVGSIGIPMVNTDFKIVDPSTGEEIGYNEEGEFCISGPTVMVQDYFGNTKKHSISLGEDGKKWLHTGDMGYIDEDGIVFYTQRLDRMFESSGVNVYPDSIERELEKVDEIESSIVVPMEDEYKGNVPVAFIKMKNGTLGITPALVDKLKSQCKMNLDRYHQPVKFVPVEDFPETALGKMDYKTLIKRMKFQHN